MKEVFEGKAISEYVGLKSKMLLCSRMMVNNLIQQKELILRLSLMNL